jgi:hypothetical protein
LFQTIQCRAFSVPEVGQRSFIDRVKPIKSLIVEKTGWFAVDESNKSSNQKLFFPVPNPLQQ